MMAGATNIRSCSTLGDSAKNGLGLCAHREGGAATHPAPVSGVLNLSDRTKNVEGTATEQQANFVVELSRTDW